ncbi:MAG: hypothetical protein K5756_05395 [Clostridiales bacterium]|nr:hypothetical protein [Clostridiales bacterium]
MKKLTKAIALLLVFASVFALTACGKKNAESTVTTDEYLAMLGDDDPSEADVTEDASTADEVTTDGATQADVTTVGETTTIAEVTAAADETTTEDPNKLPETKEEILAAYSEVMNNSKALKPGYTRIEWQDLPEEKRNIDGGVAKQLIKLAGMFMESKENATKNPEIKAKGGDMKYFPVPRAEKGCYLTNANAIKSASCKKQNDGTIKIVIELKPEMNSEPYFAKPNNPSNVGSMFGPLSLAEINKEITGNPAIKIVVKDVEFTLKYYNCIATLIYDPETMRAKAISQVMDTLIDTSGKILGSPFSGSAVLHNDLKIININY